MPESSFVTHVAETLYGFAPQSIEPLDQYPFDWRGIYRVRDPQGEVWVMRLLQLPEAVDSLTHTARLLGWLAQQSYPAPSVRVTTDQQVVGMIDGWVTSLLSYVDGHVLGPPTADDLRAVAQTLGRLHRLQVDEQQRFVHSRCHPDCIATAVHQLERNQAKVPQPFQPLVTSLHAAMLALQQQLGDHLCITHGDSWYRNAIKGRDGSVTLIDWDQAGTGLGLLDLGNLLLTAHFDLDQPLQLDADDAKISAIMHGYQQQVSIRQQEIEGMANLMRFLLAFQLGSYLADDALFLKPDFSFVLQKLEARYRVTREIAERAVKYIEHP